MQRNNYQHKILDVVQATGGDIVVKNRYLYINGNLMWKMDDVERNGVVKIAVVSSVTAGVLTFTPPGTPVVGTTYTIQVTVPNPTATGVQQNPLVFNISVVSTGTTPTTLVTQFTNLINATTQSYNTYFVASGSTTLILTATTAYPVIVGSPTSPITLVQTTQGVPLEGQQANMFALGVTVNTVPAQLGQGNPTNTQWLSGTSGTLSNSATTGYVAYACESALDIGENNTVRANQLNKQILWVNAADANAATFVTDLDNVLGGFKIDGTTVNIHQLEVNQKNTVQ